MADSRHITSASSFATTLSARADAIVDAKRTMIQCAADTLASLMADVHGGSWRVHVEHGADSSFIMIRPLLGQAIAQPKHGEVV